MAFRRIPIHILLATLLIGNADVVTAQRSISGKVISALDSLGIKDINVEFTQADGSKKRTQTDSLGFYRFDNITYIEQTENLTPLQIRTGVWSNPSSAPVFGYSLPSAAQLTIKVYDVLGREVRTLRDEDAVAGTHMVQWNGRNNRNEVVSNGVYFISMVSGNKIIASEKIAFDSRAPQGSTNASFGLPQSIKTLAKVAGLEQIAFSDSTLKRFTTYIDQKVASSTTKYDVPLIPDIKLDVPIGTTLATLQQLYQWMQWTDYGSSSTVANVGRLKVNLDSINVPTGVPTNWFVKLRKGLAINSAYTHDIDEVTQRYEGKDHTNVKVKYVGNGAAPLFIKDGTLEILAINSQGRPIDIISNYSA